MSSVFSEVFCFSNLTVFIMSCKTWALEETLYFRVFACEMTRFLDPVTSSNTQEWTQFSFWDWTQIILVLLFFLVLKVS